MSAATLPALLEAHAKGPHAGEPALREKHHGIWHVHSWRACRDRVAHLTHGLRRLGFSGGNTLLVLGDNRSQLYWSMIAAQVAGGSAVPFDHDAPDEDFCCVLDHVGARFIAVQGQQQVDRLLALRDRLPTGVRIVYADPKGMRHYTDLRLISFAEVESLGAEEAATTPNAFGVLVASLRDDDTAFIVYTPGTTGPRKGVRLSHRALMAAARGVLAVYPVRRQEDLVAVLPLAWIGDVLLSTAVFLVAGAILNCPEDTATARHDFREIGPAIMLAPPKVWEGLHQEIAARIETSGVLKRGLARWFFARALDSMRGAGVGATRRSPRGLADLAGEWLIFAPLRDRLGLRRLRAAFSTGGLLASEVRLGLRAIGVNLTPLYGVTECGGIVAVSRGDDGDAGGVGKPVSGVAVRVTPDGEILVRSESLFDGYHEDPGAARDAVRDGWIATGDAGRLTEDGSLILVDRMADLMRLKDGSTVAPQIVESQLRLSRYISQAVAVGHEQRYVAALICLDPVQVGAWASRHGVKLSSPGDTVHHSSLHRLIRGEIDRINQKLPTNHRVVRFAILPSELRADDGELTRLHVVRRHIVHVRYKALIDALFESVTAVGTETGAVVLRVVSLRRDAAAVVIGEGADLDREKVHG